MRPLLSALTSGLLAFALVVPALANHGPAEGAANVPAQEMKMKRKAAKSAPANAPCVQVAVAMRESALSGAFSAFSASISTAYAARATALNAAWGNSDATARKSAVKAAWEAFRQSAKDARKTMKTATKAAWKTFKTSAKACGTADTGESSVESVDEAV